MVNRTRTKNFPENVRKEPYFLGRLWFPELQMHLLFCKGKLTGKIATPIMALSGCVISFEGNSYRSDS